MITGVVRAGDAPGRRRVRAPARRDRRVHRRGGHLAGRPVPVLRGARHLDAARAVPRRQRRRHGHRRPRRQRGGRTGRAEPFTPTILDCLYAAGPVAGRPRSSSGGVVAAREPAVKPRVWLAVGAAVWAVVLVVAGIAVGPSRQADGARADHDRRGVADPRPGGRRGGRGRRRPAGSSSARRLRADGGRLRSRQPRRRAVPAGRDASTRLPGEEPALIDRVAAALPPAYKAAVRHVAGRCPRCAPTPASTCGSPAASTAPGELRFIADTGCRVARRRPCRNRPRPASPPSADDVLDPARRRRHARVVATAVRCPSGGELRRDHGDRAAARRAARRRALPTGVAPIIARDGPGRLRARAVSASRRTCGPRTCVVTAATGCQ